MNNRLELENISLKRKLGISEVENIEVKTQNAPKTILR
jgi:regulator of replication initiation timing